MSVVAETPGGVITVYYPEDDEHEKKKLAGADDCVLDAAGLVCACDVGYAA